MTCIYVERYEADAEGVRVLGPLVHGEFRGGPCSLVTPRDEVLGPVRLVLRSLDPLSTKRFFGSYQVTDYSQLKYLFDLRGCFLCGPDMVRPHFRHFFAIMKLSFDGKVCYRDLGITQDVEFFERKPHPATLRCTTDASWPPHYAVFIPLAGVTRAVEAISDPCIDARFPFLAEVRAVVGEQAEPRTGQVFSLRYQDKVEAGRGLVLDPADPIASLVDATAIDAIQPDEQVF